MKDTKYRIVKFTNGDTSVYYEVQKKTWFGKWVNAFPAIEGFPVTTFKTFNDAESAYYCSLVDPIAEVVKEY